ncbi:hypothetical protein [Pseudomonas syringae]|uniref:hypothetical protein n=1 Tax=Pseudomonas syringae TaxID=317 RepID=UPI001F07BBE0|nr:hypothetical protein [Pseudomonas syringae]
MKYELHLGDCLAVLRGLPANSIDSVLTDPPYDLSFMGKSWDGKNIDDRLAYRASMPSHAEAREPNQGIYFLSLVHPILTLGCKATTAHIFF